LVLLLLLFTGNGSIWQELLLQVTLIISLGRTLKKLTLSWEMHLVIYQIDSILLDRKLEKHMELFLKEREEMLKEILILQIMLGIKY